MADRSQRGFTLLELVVVILVITVLVALLLPAIGTDGGDSRRIQCTNRQKQLAMANLIFDGQLRRFPGYWASHPSSPDADVPVHMTWVTALMPYVEQQQIYDLAFGPKFDPDFFAGDDPPYIAVFICPSDPPDDKIGGPLSYVANCGRVDVAAPRSAAEAAQRTTPVDWPGNGLFSVRFPREVREANPLLDQPMTSADVADGLASTLLLSENVQAGPWWVAPPPSESSWPLETERALGFIWSPDLNPDDPRRPARPERQINEDRGRQLTPAARQFDMTYARPSSNHPGGVNAAFADGSVNFISERIDYRVYCQLMTSDSSRLGEPGGAEGPPPGAKWAADAVDSASLQ